MSVPTYLDDDGKAYRDYPSGRLYDLDSESFLVRLVYRPSGDSELIGMGTPSPDKTGYIVHRLDYWRLLDILRFRPRLNNIPARYRSGYRFCHLPTSR